MESTYHDLSEVSWEKDLLLWTSERCKDGKKINFEEVRVMNKISLNILIKKNNNLLGLVHYYKIWYKLN